MAQQIETLSDIAADYDAIVFDQWGVLHNGSTPYSKAVAAINGLHDNGHKLAVLSNSGKRSTPNALRIAKFGFAQSLFCLFMTSGEALWNDIANRQIEETIFFAIERSAGDAQAFALGLKIELVDDVKAAQAILLMGLPDGDKSSDWAEFIAAALALDIPMYCSNPDRASPRAHGITVVSPGALAHEYRDLGGKVTFYGKPHRPVFEAVQKALGSERLLMVGDSLEHDIAGAHNVGWDTALVQNGLYEAEFAQGDHQATLALLAEQKSAPHPTYMIGELR